MFTFCTGKLQPSVLVGSCLFITAILPAEFIVTDK